MLDDMVVHEGWAQFNDDLLGEWYSELDKEPVIDITIKRFSSTSPEVLNTVVDVLGRAVDEELGLENLTIEGFYDENKLEEWPLGQLVLKTHQLQSLKFDGLYTTADNRSLLLEFAAKAVTFSSCMRTLHIEWTLSSGADGDKFMQVLANDVQFDSLHSLTIVKE